MCMMCVRYRYFSGRFDICVKISIPILSRVRKIYGTGHRVDYMCTEPEKRCVLLWYWRPPIKIDLPSSRAAANTTTAACAAEGWKCDSPVADTISRCSNSVTVTWLTLRSRMIFYRPVEYIITFTRAKFVQFWRSPNTFRPRRQ